MFLFGLVCSILLIYICYQIWRGRARVLPGVPLLGPWEPVLGNVRFVNQIKHKLYDVIFEALRKHNSHVHLSLPGLPPILYLRPNEANIRHIMKDNFAAYGVPEYRLQVLEELFGEGIFASNGETWLKQRKAASHVFSLRELRGFVSSVIVEHGEMFLDKLAKVPKGTAIDMQKEFFRFTMDTFAKIALGENINSMHKDDVPLATSYDRLQELSVHRLWDPFWTLKRFLNIGSEREVRAHAGVIYKLVDELVQSRKRDFANSLNRSDLITHFLTAAADNSTTLSDRELREIVINFLVAGRDTTATALSWFFYELTRNPEIEEKVRAEINSHLHGDPSKASYETTREMVYLEGALMESIRLHPPVPADDKQAFADDVLPDGTKIPKGTVVNFHPFTAGRWEEVWGPDVLTLKPERWLDPLQQHNEFKFPHFNAGRRICLGKPLALLEAKMVVAMLLSKYTFKLSDKPVDYLMTITLNMKNGLWLIPQPL